MHNFRFFALVLCCFACWFPLQADRILKDNMAQAEPGDYIVAMQNKAYTLLLIQAKNGPVLTIEEVSVPIQKIPQNMNWREWFARGASGNTCWIRYRLNLQTGQMLDAFSFTQGGWFTISQADNLISKLMNLNFAPIPLNERKKAGSPSSLGLADRRPIWQPRLIVDGRQIPGVPFDGWRARWPRDNSELSGKMVEVYLPSDAANFQSYFPYWLEVQGVVGNAKVRVVDSGKGLNSPQVINRTSMQ